MQVIKYHAIKQKHFHKPIRKSKSCTKHSVRNNTSIYLRNYSAPRNGRQRVNNKANADVTPERRFLLEITGPITATIKGN